MTIKHPVRSLDLPDELCKIRLCAADDYLIQKVFPRKRSVSGLCTYPLKLRICSGSSIKRNLAQPLQLFSIMLYRIRLSKYCIRKTLLRFLSFKSIRKISSQLHSLIPALILE